MNRSPLKVSQHPSKFGGREYYGSVNVIVLICHVISQDHVIKESCDFKGWNPSR